MPLFDDPDFVADIARDGVDAWDWTARFIGVVILVFAAFTALGAAQAPRKVEDYVTAHTHLVFARQADDAIAPLLLFESDRVGGRLGPGLGPDSA